MRKSKRKERIGVVVSDKMQKTIVVRVTRLTKHPRYGKIVKKSTKFKVHDEKGIAKVGDVVKIRETRPLSKDKRFYLVEILKKAQTVSLKPEETLITKESDLSTTS